MGLKGVIWCKEYDFTIQGRRKAEALQALVFLGEFFRRRGQLINVDFLGKAAQTAWIKPQGRLNRSQIFELGSRLQALQAQGCLTWVLDLSQVQGISPEALGLMAHWGALGNLSLAGLQEQQQQLLQAARLEGQCKTYRDLAEFLQQEAP